MKYINCRHILTILVVFYGSSIAQQQPQQQQPQKPPQQQQPQKPPQQQQQPPQKVDDKPKFCSKLDFNRPSYPEFGPDFIIKEYKPPVTPFRPPSRHYLTNNFNDYSFVLPRMKFSLNQTTIIEAAINFRAVGNAFFDIIVYDVNTNSQEQVLHINGTKGWILFKKNIPKNIPNARIKMNANNLNAQCLLAIEYIHVLNTAIKTPECTSVPPIPPTTKPPPTTWPPTRVEPTPKPLHPNQIWWWSLTAACLAIILVMTILTGIYCHFDARHTKDLATA